jgi:anti-sigma factor RsiW
MDMRAESASVVCDRVRAQVSLELDGELSQLEQRMLTAHLERCAECARYAEDVRDLTRRIRSAPLAQMQRPVVVRRRRPITTTRIQIGVAAALALAALGLGTELAAVPASQNGSFARFDGKPSLSPPRSVVEREEAILRVVRVGRGLPSPGSVI